MAKQALTDEELLSAISAAEAEAIGLSSVSSSNSTIASDRADAVDRYLGKPYGDEIQGRSQVISRDVSDVVQGVLANVLKPFVGGEEVVEFQAYGPEDEEAAKQETDYINFIALERNNGFVVLSNAMHNALLLRTGYVKCGWTKRSDVVLEKYQGLNDEELGLALADKGVEVSQHTEYPDPYAMPPQPQEGAAPQPAAGGPGGAMPPPPMLHDVVLRRTKPTEFVEVIPVPPDEIVVSQRAREPSLQQTDFVQHRSHQTLSELRQMGYEVPDDIPDNDGNDESLEEFARQRFGQSGDTWNDPTSDPSRRIVMFKESYVRIDHDGDGIAELRRVCHVGRTVLANEETDIIPIVCFSAILMPHQHIGSSVYDLVQDLAQIKTALMRQFLDNKYLANNGRTAVDTNRVNIDDLLVSRPGGIVRGNGNPSEWMMPIVTPDTGSSALEALTYLDDVRESRTGYSRQSQGVAGDQLDSKTLGGMQIQMSQSQIRLEMISRTIAETGIRDMFRVIHALTLKHSTREEKVKLRNKWVVVNPREWVTRTDLKISVGLGNAVPGMQMQNLQLIGGIQEKLQPLGLVGPDEAYTTASKMITAAGYKNVAAFIKEPQKDQNGQTVTPPPQPLPQVQVEQIRQQGDQARLQAESQAKSMELQQKDASDQRRLAAEQAVQQSNDQRDAAKTQMEYELKSRIAQMELQQQDMQHQRDKEVEIQLANIKAANALEIARVSAAQSDGAILLQQEEKQAGYQMQELLQTLVKTLSAPKQIIRDQSGRAVAFAPAPNTVQ